MNDYDIAYDAVLRFVNFMKNNMFRKYQKN